MGNVLVRFNQASYDAQSWTNLKARHLGWSQESKGFWFKREDGSEFGDPVFVPSIIGQGMGRRVSQVAHGLLKTSLVRHDGTGWVLAQATNDPATLASHMVVRVLDQNLFEIASFGSWNLGGTPTGRMYLSTTAGQATATAPTDAIVQEVATGDGVSYHIKFERISVEFSDQPSGKALMSPVSGAGKPSFRAIEQSDIAGGPFLPLAGGTLGGDLFLPRAIANEEDGLFAGPTGLFDHVKIRYYGGGGGSIRSAIITTDGEIVSGPETVSPNGDRYIRSTISGYIEELFPASNSSYGWKLRYNAFGDYEVFAGPVYGSTEKVFSVSQAGKLFALGGLFLGSTPTERINALGDGFLRNLSISGLTNGTIPLVSTAGGLLGNSSLSEDATSVKCSKSLNLDEPAGAQRRLRFRSGGLNRFSILCSGDPETGGNAGSDLAIFAFNDAGVTIDIPVFLTRAAGGFLSLNRPITTSSTIKTASGLGVHGVTPPTSRPTISGQRTATATLAALFQALSETGLILDSTTGSSVTREAIIQPLPITNSAPGTVTVVSGGIKSFGFDGNASTEELFYHCDVQHDYIAGGNMVFHIHWMPATATGGNVKWQIEYQWVEGGATWPAPTTLTGTDAAGATAWADKRTDITIPGAGRTYNSRLMVRLFRVPTDAADTYAGDAVLSSVGMHYQADPGQP